MLSKMDDETKSFTTELECMTSMEMELNRK